MATVREEIRCKRCGQEKDADEGFYRLNGKVLQPCKKCRSDRQKKQSLGLEDRERDTSFTCTPEAADKMGPARRRRLTDGLLRLVDNHNRQGGPQAGLSILRSVRGYLPEEGLVQAEIVRMYLEQAQERHHG